MRNLDNIKLGIDAYIKLNGYTRASFAKKHSIDKVAFRCLKYGSTTNIPEIIQEKILKEIMDKEGITLEDLDVSRKKILELEKLSQIEQLGDKKLMSSRDPKRINLFLEEFKFLWSMYPDLRFGQLVNILSSKIEGDPFYAEDDKWLDVIKEKIEDNDTSK